METWYVLEDGTPVAPEDVAPDEKGQLVTKDGRAVARRPGVNAYSTRSLDPDAERAAQRERAAAEREKAKADTAAAAEKAKAKADAEAAKAKAAKADEEKAGAKYENRAMKTSEGE